MQNNAVRIHFFPKQIRLKELVLFLFPVILNAEHWLKTQHGYFFTSKFILIKKKIFNLVNDIQLYKSYLFGGTSFLI